MSNPNQPSTGVRGGASAIPTPANNPHLQGGGNTGVRNQGAGHVGIGAPKESEGGFLGLNQQKGMAEDHYFERAGLKQPGTEEEDRSFAQTKPGGSQDTLPGWETVKNVAGHLIP